MIEPEQSRVNHYMTTVNQVCLHSLKLLHHESGKNSAKKMADAAANSQQADDAGFDIISAVFATASSSLPQHPATYVFAEEVSDGFHIDRSDESILASAHAESASAAGAEEQQCNFVAQAAVNHPLTVAPACIQIVLFSRYKQRVTLTPPAKLGMLHKYFSSCTYTAVAVPSSPLSLQQILCNRSMHPPPHAPAAAKMPSPLHAAQCWPAQVTCSVSHRGWRQAAHASRKDHCTVFHVPRFR